MAVFKMISGFLLGAVTPSNLVIFFYGPDSFAELFHEQKEVKYSLT